MRLPIKQIIIGMILIIGAYAQFPGDPNDRPEPGMPPGEPGSMGFDRREKIEEIRIWKMTTYLDLTTDQAVKFFPLLKEHEARMYSIIEKQQKATEELINKCQDEKYNPSDKEIVDFFNIYEKFDAKVKKEKSDFVKNKLEFLTNQQKVKYIVFDSRFKSHLLQALKEHNRK